MKSFSWAQWLLIVPALLIGYLALEMLGDRVLNLPFWKRMSSWAKVLLLVAILCLVFVAIAFAVHFIGSA